MKQTMNDHLKAMLMTVMIAFVTRQGFPADATPDAEVISPWDAWRESLQEKGTLKAHLQSMLSMESDVVSSEDSTWGEARRFRDAANVSDEHLSAVLIELYRDASEKKQLLDSADRDVRWKAIHMEQEALTWLGTCVDRPSRAFLLEVAKDKSVEGFLRTTAVASYLRVASPDEAKRALIRFLIEDERMGYEDRQGIYTGASEVYDGASARARGAIRAAILVAAAYEERKDGFLRVDAVLAAWSDVYRRSQERMALMERHRIVRANGWDISICNASKSVNTNLTVLKSLNFDRSMIGVGAANAEHSGQYMLDLATDDRFEEMLRFGFLQNYLNGADAEGVKDALIRFLVGDARMKHRHLVYVYAMAVYGQTENADTRRAIIAALLVAAGREEVLDLVVELDDMLAERSESYRRSRQRYALLKWHALKLPTGNPQVDNPLKIALAEVGHYWKHTDVNMSLSALQARDFSQPLTPQEVDIFGGSLRMPKSRPRAHALKNDTTSLCLRAGWPYAVGGVIVLVLVASGFWLFKWRPRTERP